MAAKLQSFFMVLIQLVFASQLFASDFNQNIIKTRDFLLNCRQVIAEDQTNVEGKSIVEDLYSNLQLDTVQTAYVPFYQMDWNKFAENVDLPVRYPTVKEINSEFSYDILHKAVLKLFFAEWKFNKHANFLYLKETIYKNVLANSSLLTMNHPERQRVVDTVNKAFGEFKKMVQKSKENKLRISWEYMDQDKEEQFITDFNRKVKNANHMCSYIKATYDDNARRYTCAMVSPFLVLKGFPVPEGYVDDYIKFENSQYGCDQMLEARYKENKRLERNSYPVLSMMYDDLMSSELGYMMVTREMSKKVNTFEYGSIFESCMKGDGKLFNEITRDDVTDAKAGFLDLIARLIDKIDDNLDPDLDKRQRVKKIKTVLEDNPMVVVDLIAKNPSPGYAHAICQYTRDIYRSDRNRKRFDQVAFGGMLAFGLISAPLSGTVAAIAEGAYALSTALYVGSKVGQIVEDVQRKNYLRMSAATELIGTRHALNSINFLQDHQEDAIKSIILALFFEAVNGGKAVRSLTKAGKSVVKSGKRFIKNAKQPTVVRFKEINPSKLKGLNKVKRARVKANHFVSQMRSCVANMPKAVARTAGSSIIGSTVVASWGLTIIGYSQTLDDDQDFEWSEIAPDFLETTIANILEPLFAMFGGSTYWGKYLKVAGVGIFKTMGVNAPIFYFSPFSETNGHNKFDVTRARVESSSGWALGNSFIKMGLYPTLLGLQCLFPGGTTFLANTAITAGYKYGSSVGFYWVRKEYLDQKGLGPNDIPKIQED